MKLLILGYGRHGKDTVAKLIGENLNLTWTSSSYAALEHAIWPVIGHRYDTKEQCFADRHNHRREWHELIKHYNTPDKARLAKDILNTSDIYVGMRCIEEFFTSEPLFDLVIWVDASQRVPPEPEDSCTVTKDLAHIIINNNASCYRLKQTIHKVFPKQ